MTHMPSRDDLLQSEWLAANTPSPLNRPPLHYGRPERQPSGFPYQTVTCDDHPHWTITGAPDTVDFAARLHLERHHEGGGS